MPTFLMPLSSPDMKWNELVSTINKLHKLDLSEHDIENLSYHDSCCSLSSNPVLDAKHFQNQVEVFF